MYVPVSPGWHTDCLDVRAMDNMTSRRSTNPILCRCTRCTRDRLVLSSLSPRIARVLRQAIDSNR